MTRVLHVDPAREWRGGQAQLAALLQARPDDVWAGAPDGELARRVRPPDVVLRGDAGWLNAARVRAGAVRLGVDVVAAHSSHAHDACLAAPVPLVVHRRNHRPPGNVWKYGRAARVVAVSEWVAARCRAAGVARVEVVHDGADGVELPARPPRPPTYLVPAALVPHKGHAALLDLFAAVPGGLVVAGEGPLRAALAARAAPLGERVRFVGRVDVRAVLYGMADVVVLPSLDEAGGSVVVEAMACGLPVVAARVGGIPELVGTAGVLVAPGDTAGWVAALRAAPGSADPAALRAQASRFSVAEMVRRTARIYREVGGG